MVFFELAIFLLIFLICSRFKYYKLHFKLPGPVGYPLLGMAHRFFNVEKILSTFGEFEDRYGGVFFSWLGPLPYLVVSEPQSAKDILTSPSCIDKGLNYNALAAFIGNGIFTSNEPKWSFRRKLLNPSFHNTLLTTSFIPVFSDEADKLLVHLKELCGKGAHNIKPIIQTSSFNIAARTIANIDLSKDKSKYKDLIPSHQKVMKDATEIIFLPVKFFKILCFPKSEEYANNGLRFFSKHAVRNTLDLVSSNPDDTENSLPHTYAKFITSLYHKGNLNLEDLDDEMTGMLLAAFEVTSQTMTHALIMLAMFPKYQEKAFKELVLHFPNRASLDMTNGKINQLTYLDMVLKESMRVIPSVPIVGRKTTSNLQLSNGIKIPEGVQVVLDIFHLHRNKQIWGPNADKFNPENFLPDNLESKHQYSYIPYMKGIRTCIGHKYSMLALKINLAKVLRNYEFKTTFKFDDLFFMENITIKLKEIPLLEVSEREF